MSEHDWWLLAFMLVFGFPLIVLIAGFLLDMWDQFYNQCIKTRKPGYVPPVLDLEDTSCSRGEHSYMRENDEDGVLMHWRCFWCDETVKPKPSQPAT